MASLRTEVLDDKVRAHYHLAKPHGMLDVHASVEIPLDTIRSLKPVPKELFVNGFHLMKFVEVFVPPVRSTIVFVFISFQESMSRNEEVLHGPYLKTDI